MTHYAKFDNKISVKSQTWMFFKRTNYFQTWLRFLYRFLQTFSFVVEGSAALVPTPPAHPPPPSPQSCDAPRQRLKQKRTSSLVKMANSALETDDDEDDTNAYTKDYLVFLRVFNLIRFRI